MRSHAGRTAVTFYILSRRLPDCWRHMAGVWTILVCNAAPAAGRYSGILFKEHGYDGFRRGAGVPDRY